jgi:type II restriction/modification system DNA methylase subunit YeeA
MERIVIHTNWTNTVSETHTIPLDELKNANKRELLRAVFTDPKRLKPKKTIDALTREVADKFAGLAFSLRDKGHDPLAVAHFVNRLVFCMFAGDINFLPHRLFSEILDRAKTKPDIATALLKQLFSAMRSGGLFGVDEIEWFNGGLFDDDSALPLTRADIKTIGEAAAFDWSDIEPSIFGTLFERGLDPSKRSQLGAHYTDPEKIMMIVRPVIIEPLWREWEATKALITKPKTAPKRKRALLNGYLERLHMFRVLDPACGSGKFLYLALLSLKDLEHRVNLEGESLGLGRQFPSVGPEVVQGIELNLYAAELARVTIWIGEIQWMRKNGFDVSRNPILKPLKSIQNRDALIKSDGSETTWPKADAIIGNPPFLGDKKMYSELGRDYTDTLRSTYKGQLAGRSDLVCYWFAKAHRIVKAHPQTRVGLVATNSIKQASNRGVLTDICADLSIYEAWSDEPWTVEGAAVRVAIICFANSKPKPGDVPIIVEIEEAALLASSL